MLGTSLRDRASRASHGAAARLRHPATIACAYAAMAVFTYGHSAAQSFRLENAEYAACQAERLTKPDRYCFDGRVESAAIGGAMSAVLWPLYWSWELQQ